MPRLDSDGFPFDLPKVSQLVLVALEYQNHGFRSHYFETAVAGRGNNGRGGWYIIAASPGAPFTKRLELYLSPTGDGCWYAGKNTDSFLHQPGAETKVDVYLADDAVQANGRTKWMRFKPAFDKAITLADHLWRPPAELPLVGQQVLLYLYSDSQGCPDHNLEATVEGRGQNDQCNWYFTIVQPGAPFSKRVEVYFDRGRWHIGDQSDQFIFGRPEPVKLLVEPC